jgi:hypothetical protein
VPPVSPSVTLNFGSNRRRVQLATREVDSDDGVSN